MLKQRLLEVLRLKSSRGFFGRHFFNVRPKSNLSNDRWIVLTYVSKYKKILTAGMSLFVGFLCVVYLEKRRKAAKFSAASREMSPMKQLDGRHLPRLEKRFLDFASLEYHNEIFMSPADFLHSVTRDEPAVAAASRVARKKFDESQARAILKKTPRFKYNSKSFFRKLGNDGLISYTEYLLLLCILTKPEVGFKIAFDMFDTDGSKTIDQGEFLVITSWLTNTGNSAEGPLALEKVMSRGRKGPEKSEKQDFLTNDAEPAGLMPKAKTSFSWVWSRAEMPKIGTKNTTLLVHLFGEKGDGKLPFDEFRKFMDNVQTEVLEIEFSQFSHGSLTLKESDFVQILLRYAPLTSEDKKSYMQRVHKRIVEEKGISFEQFRLFCRFLNTLEDFTIAVKLYTFADLPVSQAEFARAVKVATGFTLDPHVIDVVFKIFDTNDNGSLSYNEFIGVMKERIHRGIRTRATSTDFWPSFKRCIREEAKRY